MTHQEVESQAHALVVAEARVKVLEGVVQELLDTSGAIAPASPRVVVDALIAARDRARAILAAGQRAEPAKKVGRYACEDCKAAPDGWCASHAEQRAEPGGGPA